MPAWKTVCEYTPVAERRLFSPTTLSHNKQVEGQDILLRYIALVAGIPKDFRAFCLLSQYAQSEALRASIEHWRGRMFDTAGTLFWMGNDCWPGASYACLDYKRRRRAAYYAVRRLYKPILPVLECVGDVLSLLVVSELDHKARADVRLAGYAPDGEQLFAREWSATLGSDCVNELGRFDARELGVAQDTCMRARVNRFTNALRPVNAALRGCFAFAEVWVEGERFFAFASYDPLRELNRPRPSISIKREGTRVTLCADAPCAFVWLEPERDVTFTDNALCLEPNQCRALECSDEPGEIEILTLEDLTVCF